MTKNPEGESDLPSLESKLQALHELVEQRFEQQLQLLQGIRKSGNNKENKVQVEEPDSFQDAIEDWEDASLEENVRDSITEKQEVSNVEEDTEDVPKSRSMKTETSAKKAKQRQTFKMAAARTGQWIAKKRQTIVVHAKRSTEQQLPEKGVRRWASVLVYSPVFTYTITMLILVHVVLLGIEVDLSATLPIQKMPDWFSTFNAVSVCCFVIELILKFIALGCSDFWYGSDSYWNIFDFIVIMVSVIDVVLDFWARILAPSMNTGQLRLLRSIRFARALRSIRIVRLFRYIGALRTLALSILSTMVSLFWTLALLIILFYSFAVVLTQLVVEHCRFLGMDGAVESLNPPMEHCPSELRKYWHNVPESMLTLFMAISQGLNWEDAMEPLRDVSALAVGLVILYVVITVFAILNVVTGVFLNTAIESAGADKDVATIRQVQMKAQQVEALQQIFREIDRDNENEVRFEDVRNAMMSGELASFMESLGISTDDVRTLFTLLDSDHRGFIDLDEFVSGCMQLHGPAKSMQMAKLSYDNKRVKHALNQLTKEMSKLRRRLTGGSNRAESDGVAISEKF